MYQSIFASARIRLTIQYTVMIALIGTLLSGLFYLRASSVIQMEYDRINLRLVQEENGIGRMKPPAGMHRRITFEDLQSARSQLIKQLVIINVFVLLVTCLSSWYLSGVTLKPIKRALDEQKRFVADAAHELKTPVAAMKTALEVQLLDKKVPADIKRMIKDNLGDVILLEKLAARLLAMTTHQDGVMVQTRVDLQTPVEKAVRIIKPLATMKNIQVITKVEPVAVRAHEESMVELLVILLDNAVKYSRKDSQVKVHLQALGRNAVVSVSDGGIGIETKHIPHIFNRFYRVDASRNKVDGHGLGLALAKTIALRHKGTLTVKSTLGRGSTFTLTLPKA